MFILCDCWVFLKGYDSLLQQHKTEAEKEIQKIKIDKLRQKSTIDTTDNNE